MGPHGTISRGPHCAAACALRFRRLPDVSQAILSLSVCWRTCVILPGGVLPAPSKHTLLPPRLLRRLLRLLLRRSGGFEALRLLLRR